MRTKRTTLGLATLLLGILSSAVAADAHFLVNLYCRVLFNFDGGSVNAIGESWTFDEHYSRHLLADFDTDNDGTFSPGELAKLKATVLPNLSQRRYFTYVSVDGSDVGKIEPYTFNAVVRHGLITFTMSLQLPYEVDPSKAHLEVNVHDISIIAMFIGKPAIVLRGGGGTGCSGRPVDGSGPGVAAATIVCRRD